MERTTKKRTKKATAAIKVVATPAMVALSTGTTLAANLGDTDRDDTLYSAGDYIDRGDGYDTVTHSSYDSFVNRENFV